MRTEDHLTSDEMEWCVERLMPIVREYGTLGLELAGKEAGRRWMDEIEGVPEDDIDCPVCGSNSPTHIQADDDAPCRESRPLSEFTP